MRSWRHDLHQHPEFGFSEHRTASFIADRLREFKFDEVTEGVGLTGVVGMLKNGTGSRSIALRADIDGLRITENNAVSYCSLSPGLMHACGHDGHIAMLLGAAKWLADEGRFNGTVYFIFQPAEEWGHGARAMLSDRLLERFPFTEIYGLHNWPGLPVGTYATCYGPLMAAEDIFEIKLTGMGGHASQPHTGHEVLVAASSLVMTLQTIVSRRIDPSEIAVVSVTEFITDGLRNVLPGEVILKGDVRSFLTEVSETIEAEMRQQAAGIALAYGCQVEVKYTRVFLPLVNESQATMFALHAAANVFRHESVINQFKPVTVAEDFAQFLKFVPGNFAFIGNGRNSFPLHHALYDFNDEALIYGARYFIALVQSRLNTN